MDNFMSKLSQKINAQDAIRVNFMADAAEKEQMMNQLKENSAVCAKVLEKLEAMEQPTEVDTAFVEELKECISKSDEFTHKECVKVYRNVQAVLEEQNKKSEVDLEVVKNRIAGIKIPEYSETFNILLEKGNQLQQTAKFNKVMLIVLAVLSAANLVCTLLIHFGLF